MNNPHSLVTPIRKQAIDVLKRARKLPVGHDRNDLRQLAIGLLWLEKHGHTKPLHPSESHALSE